MFTYASIFVPLSYVLVKITLLLCAYLSSLQNTNKIYSAIVMGQVLLFTQSCQCRPVAVNIILEVSAAAPVPGQVKSGGGI